MNYMSYTEISKINLTLECQKNNIAEVNRFFDLWKNITSKQKGRIAKKNFDAFECTYPISSSFILILVNRQHTGWTEFIPYFDDKFYYFSLYNNTSAALLYACDYQDEKNIKYLLEHGGFSLKNLFNENNTYKKQYYKEKSLDYIVEFYVDLLQKNPKLSSLYQKRGYSPEMEKIFSGERSIEKRTLDVLNIKEENFIAYCQAKIFHDFKDFKKNNSQFFSVYANTKMQELEINLSMDIDMENNVKKVKKI